MWTEYSAPESAIIRLNLDERIACSGDPVGDPGAAEDDPEGWYVLRLSETDGVENRNRINQALKEQGRVQLAPGEYPVAPGVVVNGACLDLGGAKLVCTEMAYGGALIVMCGDHPEVVHGQLSGRYSAAPGEPGYMHVEYPDEHGNKIPIDSTIKLPVGGFSGALIDGVQMDHCFGYTICEGGENQLPTVYTVGTWSPERQPEDGVCRFILRSDRPWVTARHCQGVNYFISRSPILYKFRGEDGKIIAQASGIPGEPVRRPADAISVDVITDMEPYVRFALREMDYDSTITIRKCDFWCNQRLAIANLPGVSIVEDCRSWSNGWPREDHDGIAWDSSTSGFIDIEDIQSPRLTVRRCVSRDENLGIASRAYELIVEDCEMYVRVYGGWYTRVRGNRGCVCCNAEDVGTEVDVYDSDLCGMWAAPIGKNMRIHDCTVELCAALNWLPGFDCTLGADTPVARVMLDGVVVGRIHGACDAWFELGTQTGSDLTIRVPGAGGRGARAAVADCHGLHSNLLVLPNGHAVRGCEFMLADARPYQQAITSIVADAFCGLYEDCDFTVTVDEPFRATAAWMDKPIELTFRRCRFDVKDGLALTRGFKEGSVIRFEGCTLDRVPMTQEDAERIASHNIQRLTITVSGKE